MIDASKLLDSLSKIAPKTLFAIALASGVILFAPERFVQALKLDFLRDNYGEWVGCAFLVASSLLVMSAFWATGKVAQKRWKDRRRGEKLRTLTPEEKGFLLPYIKEKKTTKYSELGDGVARGLVSQEILHCPANICIESDQIAYNLCPWARTALEGNPNLLDGAIEPARPPCDIYD